jgi:hypothetical protein
MSQPTFGPDCKLVSESTSQPISLGKTSTDVTVGKKNIKFYWRYRPDRDEPSEGSVYFLVHLAFGPQNPDGIYRSREDDISKTCCLRYKEMWDGWKHFDIEFDPFRTVGTDTEFNTRRTYWAFEVTFSMPYALMNCTKKNSKILSEKQLDAPSGCILDEDRLEPYVYSESISSRICFMGAMNGEFVC